MPGLPVRSRIPSQPGDQSAGQYRTGTGAVRSRDCLDAPGGNSPGEEARVPRRDSQARWARQPGAVTHVTGPGAADRPGPDPGQLGETGPAATVTTVAAGPVAGGRQACPAAHALPTGLARLMQTA
jgi:hypothetical protein